MPYKYGRKGKLPVIPKLYDQITELELKVVAVKLATGKLTSDGFVLIKGALIKADHTSLKPTDAIIKVKRDLINESKLTSGDAPKGYLKLQSDAYFYSPHAAGRLVLGRECNGYVDWGNKNGRLLTYLLDEL